MLRFNESNKLEMAKLTPSAETNNEGFLPELVRVFMMEPVMRVSVMERLVPELLFT